MAGGRERRFLGCRNSLPASLSASEKTGGEFVNLVVAHETFHCFQYWIMTPTGAITTNRRSWLLEGSADWAALRIFRVSWDVGGGNFHVSRHAR